MILRKLGQASARDNGQPTLVIPAHAHQPYDMDDPGRPDSACQLVLGMLSEVVFGFQLYRHLPRRLP